MKKIRRLSIRILLSFFLATLLSSQSSPIRVSGTPVIAARSPSIASPLGKPITVWSLNWSSTWVSSGQDDRSYGHNTDSYHYNQSGSTLYNIYADGSSDNTNFLLHVTDDADGTGTDNNHCYPKSVFEVFHDHQTTTNPDQYNGSPQGDWTIDPSQDSKGIWSAYLHYPSAEQFTFAESDRYILTDCDGAGSDTTKILTEPWINSCFDQQLLGNAAGTIFAYHREGNYAGGGCNGPASFTPSMDQESIRWTVDVTARLLVGRDLTIKRLEVTQGLQDEANSIQLVRGRRTVVRAFLDIGTDPDPIQGVTASLEGYYEGTKLGTVKPFNPNMQMSAPSSPDWKNIDDTLNFELPIEWMQQPAFTLKMKVNPDRSVMETNYDNDDFSMDIGTFVCNPISIGYAPIHYAPPGKTASDPNISIQAAKPFMQKIYPVSEKGIVYVPRGGMTLLQDINAAHVDDNLLDSMAELLNLSSSPRPDHIFGWLPSLAYDNNGLGDWPGAAAFGNQTQDPNMWRRTFAHEIGHNFRLDHPPVDSPLTTQGDHWFDVYERVIKPVPASVGGKELLDMMVPARLESEAWISPTNYNYLMGALCPAVPPASLASAIPAGTSQTQASDNLVISGIINNTLPITAMLAPIFHNSSTVSSTPPVGSQYCVNLEDVNGDLINSYCFNENFEDDSATLTDAAGFSMVVPNPIGLRRVYLVQNPGGTVLGSQVYNTNTITVTVTYPSAAGLTLSGNQTITWTSGNLRHAKLTYDLLYSNDNGSTWMGAGANFTVNSATIDFSSLPGTNGATGLIKVLASDGFNSGQGTSSNAFTVGNKAPSASILSPSTGAAFSTGPQVVLEGSGADLEDGSLNDSGLSWTSSIDGALGTGQLREVNLSPGLHTITLTTTDSRGLQATDSIQLTVVKSIQRQYVFLPAIRK